MQLKSKMTMFYKTRYQKLMSFVWYMISQLKMLLTGLDAQRIYYIFLSNVSDFLVLIW